MENRPQRCSQQHTGIISEHKVHCHGDHEPPITAVFIEKGALFISVELFSGSFYFVSFKCEQIINGGRFLEIFCCIRVIFFIIFDAALWEIIHNITRVRE